MSNDKCILSFASRFLCPLCCINNEHDFKGWGENQRVVLHDKTWFLTLNPCWKIVPARLLTVGKKVDGAPVWWGVSFTMQLRSVACRWLNSKRCTTVYTLVTISAKNGRHTRNADVVWQPIQKRVADELGEKQTQGKLDDSLQHKKKQTRAQRLTAKCRKTTFILRR